MKRILFANTQLRRELLRAARGTFFTLITLALAASTGPAWGQTASEYRAIDGTGNNVTHPDWGAVASHLLRGGSGARYGNGIWSMGGAGRPSPRAVSNAFFNQPLPIFSAVGHSDYIWTWGQFLDHDFGLTPGLAEPAPIQVPQGDPFFDPSGTGTQVIPFNRSIFDPLTGTSISNPREQLNLIAAYIDGNTVYGSNVGTDTDRAGWLRTRVGGRLKVTSTARGDLLPYNDSDAPG